MPVDLAFPILFAFAPLLVTVRELRSWKRRFVIGWLTGRMICAVYNRATRL